MGGKVSKRYSSYSYMYDYFLTTKPFLDVPCDSPHKN